MWLYLLAHLLNITTSRHLPSLVSLIFQVSRLQGKVIFNSSANINTIIDLKAAERLFLLLKHDTPLKLPTHINQGTKPQQFVALSA